MHELLRERMPQMQDIERRLRDRIDEALSGRGEGGDVDRRLDALSEVLGDLERVLDRLLDRIERQP